jgi:predicted nucleotidyltransferase
MQNAADLYLQSTINRHRLPETDRHATISLQNWSYQKHIESITLSGSRAKSTALRDSDTDLLITLTPATPNTLSQIQKSLADHLHAQIRNVAVRVIQNNQLIDLVPSRSNTLWQFRNNCELKTNIPQQINQVLTSRRLNEIRALKIWRAHHSLRFPSFLLEQTVIQALPHRAQLAASFLTLLHHLSTCFQTVHLTDSEVHRITQAARESLKARTWPEIL